MVWTRLLNAMITFNATIPSFCEDERVSLPPTIAYPQMDGPPRVRLRDLSIHSEADRISLHSILDRFMDHGMWILGEEVEQFERAVAEFFGRKHCVGVASASAGLYLALKALGIGDGDEVITTPMSWLVTSSAIVMTGARPIFVDVDENYNLDPQSVESAITSKSRAILPVHFYGRVANMRPIVEIAQNYGLQVIEDVAQAVGGQSGGIKAGSFGQVGVASFSPMKVIASMGDAGVIVCDNDDLADRLRSLRHCGTKHGEICVEPELKHTIDALQAAVIKERLTHAAEIIAFRRSRAELYCERLRDLMIIPDLGEDLEHTVYDFTVRVPRRNEVITHLTKHLIETKVRHPLLICDQPIYSAAIKPEVPRARRFLPEILCLPMHQNLTVEQVEYVCDVVASCTALQ
jgi:dTDP-4-amino-4,6-dideoxygalactose transaminase